MFLSRNKIFITYVKGERRRIIGTRNNELLLQA
jgi:hypothetical protein